MFFPNLDLEEKVKIIEMVAPMKILITFFFFGTLKYLSFFLFSILPQSMADHCGNYLSDNVRPIENRA